MNGPLFDFGVPVQEGWGIALIRPLYLVLQCTLPVHLATTQANLVALIDSSCYSEEAESKYQTYYNKRSYMCVWSSISMCQTLYIPDFHRTNECFPLHILPIFVIHMCT